MRVNLVVVGDLPRMETAMFNPIQAVIDAFVRQLHEQYEQVYGVLEPGYPGIVEFIARLAMENIANSDAPYQHESYYHGDTGWSGDPARQTHQRGRCHATRLAAFHNLSAVS